MAAPEVVAVWLEALDSLPPGAMSGFAGWLGSPFASLLRDVERAAQEGEREKAVSAALDRLPAVVSDATLRHLLAVVQQAFAHASSLSEVVEQQFADERIDAVDAIRRRAVEVLQEVRPRIEDAEVAAVLDALIEPLQDPAPSMALRETAAAVREVQLALRSMLSSMPAEPTRPLEALSDPQLALERAQRAIQAAMGPVQALAATLSPLAEKLHAAGNDAAAAVLAGADAVLAESRGEPAEALRDRWDRVFEWSLAARDPQRARDAARRLQLAALREENFETLAVVAHRLADLGRDVGDLDLEIHARGEEAVALVGVPEHRHHAKPMAESIVQRSAGADIGLRARARLTLGLVLARLGDLASAADHFDAVLDAARVHIRRMPMEAGQAALELARIHAFEQRWPQAREHYELAIRVTEHTGDVNVNRVARALLAECPPPER